jgi:hypothetical protein
MIYIAVLVFLLLLIIYINTSDDYLYGFWLAEGDEFCEKAEIESIMLFIGSATGRIWRERRAYLIIMNDMANDALTISYTKPMFGGKFTITATPTFDEEQIWPDTVQIDVDSHSGTMKIYSGDRVYAKLYKQHETTNTAKLLED